MSKKPRSIRLKMPMLGYLPDGIKLCYKLNEDGTCDFEYAESYSNLEQEMMKTVLSNTETILKAMLANLPYVHIKTDENEKSIIANAEHVPFVPSLCWGLFEILAQIIAETDTYTGRQIIESFFTLFEPITPTIPPPPPTRTEETKVKE